MKVSKHSWHYRLYVWYRDLYDFSGEPKNLCRYFWTIVGLSLVSCIAFPITGVVIVLGTAALAAHDRYRGWRPKAPKTKTEPGLLRSFLAAKKQKVCPRIEVVP